MFTPPASLHCAPFPLNGPSLRVIAYGFFHLETMMNGEKKKKEKRIRDVDRNGSQRFSFNLTQLLWRGIHKILLSFENAKARPSQQPLKVSYFNICELWLTSTRDHLVLLEWSCVLLGYEPVIQQWLSKANRLKHPTKTQQCSSMCNARLPKVKQWTGI